MAARPGFPRGVGPRRSVGRAAQFAPLLLALAAIGVLCRRDLPLRGSSPGGAFLSTSSVVPSGACLAGACRQLPPSSRSAWHTAEGTQAQVIRRARGGGDASPRLYVALTKIRVRLAPDGNSPTLADAESTKLKNGEWFGALEPNQVFRVSEERAKDGQTYLKLADQDGWVFLRGIAGKWAGKAIVEPVKESNMMDAQIANFVDTAQRMLFRDSWDRFSVTVVAAVFLVTIILYIIVING